MTSFYNIFPLNIVAYPTEQINLHIFEPRYKQLITDCLAANKNFVLPVVIGNEIQEVATELSIIKVVNKYEGGEMDIICKGIQTVRVLEVVKDIPDKLYYGAIIAAIDKTEKNSISKQQQVVAELRKLHQLLDVNKDYKKPDEELISFDMAHHVGFSLQQEYELLCLKNEAQRLEYLHQHLSNVILTLDEREKAIGRIMLNGQFRNLSLNDFNFKKK
jgi:uncharacterized protein